MFIEDSPAQRFDRLDCLPLIPSITGSDPHPHTKHSHHQHQRSQAVAEEAAAGVGCGHELAGDSAIGHCSLEFFDTFDGDMSVFEVQ